MTTFASLFFPFSFAGLDHKTAFGDKRGNATVPKGSESSSGPYSTARNKLHINVNGPIARDLEANLRVR